MLYIFLAIVYFILIYIMLLITCVIIYSIIVILMIIGVEINKTFMCCFECLLESLFHPCSCLFETWLACRLCCERTTVTPAKEIEMIVIVNPGGMPLQMGTEAV